MTETHHDVYSKTIFGFLVYLLTDFMMFATLFATFGVLRHSTYGGPSARDLFHLPFTLTQTLILLVSSLTVGLGGAFAHRQQKNKTLILFGITFLLGIVFIGMEFSEYGQLIRQGASWKRSAFLSAYFTLLGTHAIHVFLGLLWMIVLIIPVFLSGLTEASVRRLSCLRMFWQFLNVVWIFIFAIVYVIGVSE